MAQAPVELDVGVQIPISEVFGSTIQGEGPLSGQLCAFVRVGGCDYRCSWCDTMYAVDALAYRWPKQSAEGILGTIERIYPVREGERPWVVISGGNPMLFRAVGRLIDLLHQHGYRAAVETQGSVVQSWVSEIDSLVISPKPPSSGMPWGRRQQGILEQVLAHTREGQQVVLKIVVSDEADYQFARTVNRAYPWLPVYLQPCDRPPEKARSERKIDLLIDHASNYRWLVERVLKDRWAVTVQPRLHVLAWGQERGR